MAYARRCRGDTSRSAAKARLFDSPVRSTVRDGAQRDEADDVNGDDEIDEGDAVLTNPDRESQQPGYTGITEDGFFADVATIGGMTIAKEFRSIVDGTSPIDYDAILAR